MYSENEYYIKIIIMFMATLVDRQEYTIEKNNIKQYIRLDLNFELCTARFLMFFYYQA